MNVTGTGARQHPLANVRPLRMRMIMLAAVLGCCIKAEAQEMVANGDLEQFTTCPWQMGQLELAIGWSRPTVGSSDYFNACQGGAGPMSVPTNLNGEQTPHSGAGYAGIIAFNGPDNTGTLDTHEYVSHPLAVPMVPGATYAVEFYISLAEVSKYAVNDMGALLSTQEPHRDDWLEITAAPQVTNGSMVMLDDENGWMRIAGCVKADSAYTWITIGNFHPGAGTGFEQVSQSTPVWFSYYYVDDVSVRQVPQPDFGLGPDLAICAPAVLSVADPEPGAVYQWSTGEIGSAITVDTAGTYTVQMAGDECPLADTVIVEMGLPVAIDLPADTVVNFCFTPQVRLNAHAMPSNADLVWSTGETTPSIFVGSPGTYFVQADAPGSCIGSASITVIDTCKSPVYAPNSFTPNGDGINDTWRPVWSANAGAQLTWEVFDRWGHVLYSATGPSDGWDGTVTGTPVPAGAYTWRGKATDQATSVVHQLQGEIVLLR
ncbi:MAG: T9SS type B sorting domain-containing protein [Bacteroidetes bacterium]|nr:T9SS type B sorting domain-containing protein [Bacteroidota bacterium]